MLTIGSVPIEHPFAQAALSGYSDPPMRRVARMHGASYTVNEVVLDRSVMHESDWQRQLLSLEPDAHPVGGQLMGSDPASFAPAARLLADAGYDVIDINFGCPAPKVLDRCRGGFLLSDPETALEIIGRVVDAVGDDRPVTVKMRRGHDDSAESERNFFTILDGAFDLGIAAVTVHGRTVRQRYTGASNRAFLARVKRHLGDKMMLGSGDLFTAQDCIDLMRETSVDGVSIARGAIGNPWIFQNCRALAAGETPTTPTPAKQHHTIATHLAEVIAHYGEASAGKIMSRFGVKYAKHHPEPRKVREAFAAVRSTDDFRDVLDRWYAVDNQLYSVPCAG